MCLSAVQCSAQLTPEEAHVKGCSIQGGAPGICCKEISVLGTYHVALVSPKVDSIRIRQINDDEFRTALRYGETTFQESFLRTTEMNTIKNSQSTSGQHAIFVHASPGVAQLELERKGMVAMHAAKKLALTNNGKLFLSMDRISYYSVSFSCA